MSQLFRLKNGTVLLSTEAPGGIYNSSQLKKIAELCSKELAIVKATEDQRLALFVKESEVENVAKQLRAMGLGFRHYQDSLHQPVSCLGELCEEHEQPAMATAMEITKEIASIQLSASLKIGVNGCARCCTPCHTLDISVVGDASGYRISLGGKTKQMPEFASYFAEGVPPKELPKRLKAVIEAYKSLAEDGETLHDVIERCGVTDFVQALAPYSQDAAQREDPFAKEASGESLDDLAIMEDSSLDDVSLDGESLDAESLDDASLNMESLDADESLSDESLETETADSADDEILDFEDATPAADLEMDLAVEDDLSVVDDQFDEGTLEEIPIDKAGHGSLEDDLSLGNDDVALDMNDVDFTEDSVTSSNDDSLLDDTLEDELSLDPTSAVAEDDIDLNAPELDVADDVVETLPETSDMELDESISMEDDLPEDLSADLGDDLDDSSMDLAETPLDEDLEGIPELDEDLSPEDVPAPTLVAQAPAPAPVAATHDEFGEELPADVADLSDEEESQFEEKLQASIDEESRMIAKADPDSNVGDREAALSFLESPEAMDDDLEAIELDDATLEEPLAVDDELEEISSDDELEILGDDESLDTDADTLSVADEELEPINEPMEEFPEPGPSELAHIKSRQVGQKLQGSSTRQQFKVSAIAFQDEHMRVTFDTSAYVDFDLSALGLGEERSFRLGVQNVSVTSTSEGYILEVDGMRLFHPKTSLPAAS
ncbi:MAG TPA: hypothetical protein VE954_20875 [Oligoflexus sp.]|uniref:hypothetical protein n=1 Tax=Oligoflexus sp. TaxID=1971216 RepID=UPI002D32B2D0|nr:hypothetical protein [Oligoflexus sp.]HYX35558.1 hypothetical protein [Oligoflexus sp.]